MFIKDLIIVCLVFILSSCMKTNQFDERSLMQNKVNAFQFLSDYHHQLHIMIGEEEGDGKGAYKEFLDALISNDNYEIINIKNEAKEKFIKLNFNPNNLPFFDIQEPTGHCKNNNKIN